MKRLLFLAILISVLTGCRDDESFEQPTISFYPEVAGTIEEGGNSVKIITLEFSQALPFDANIGFKVINGDFLVINEQSGRSSFDFNLSEGTEDLSFTVRAEDDVIAGDYEAIIEISSLSRAIRSTGISSYKLKVTDNDKVNLFEDNFEANNLAKWSTFSTAGSNDWETRSFADNFYAVISNFQSDVPAEDWLISPEFNFDVIQQEVLTFDTQTAFNDGNVLEVVVITDYSGGDPSNATITKLEPTLDPHRGSGFGNFTESGALDLSNISGRGHIAFHFTAIDESDGTQWQVDNVVFSGADPTGGGNQGGGPGTGGGSPDAISISDARSRTGETVLINGIVTTPDYGFNNGQFFLQDETAGINVFYPANFGVAKEGDFVEISGTIGDFNGQVQLTPNTVSVISSNNALPAAASVNGGDLSPDSDLQSQRVVIDNVTLSNPSEWPTAPIDAGSGVNVTASADGVNFIIRIDRGESFYDGSAAPDGAFTLTGILARFNDEIQILPFLEGDVGSGDGNGGGDPGPIDLITITSARSKAGETVKIRGIVTTPDYGFNNGQYFIQDATGGINIFHVGNFGLVEPGDEVEITGVIGEFGSQVQIAPSTVTEISAGNALPAAVSVNGSDLSVTSTQQSTRVVIDNVSLVDPSVWPNAPIDDGSGLNVAATADGVNFIIRIDRGESFFDGSA
ncbi:MAG: choice-of-anchor J domain-containing protein, partial [Cyclobacteriaceae bacterium]